MKNLKCLTNGITGTVVAVCMVATSSVTSFAVENGTYIVDTLTSYSNPQTGVVDDGGSKNSELGEGMARSVIGKVALLEKEDGKTLVTVRVGLHNNLKDVKMFTKSQASDEYTEVETNITAENSSENTADYCFEISNTDLYIKTTMFVVPMGREVCFYWKADESTAQSGNGDFIKNLSISNKTNNKTNTATKTEINFTDINNHWAKDEINAVVQKGLFSGVSNTTFSPDTTMTRGMFVTVLGRLSGEDVSSYSSAKFSDVDSNKYYAKYIGWASSKNIVLGTSETTFAPDKEITIEQALSIMVKYAECFNIKLEENAIDTTKIDISKASAWAKENVEKACKSGITSELNTNGYEFKTSATRADVASIIMMYSNKY